MDIDALTFGELKRIAQIFNPSGASFGPPADIAPPHPYEIGANYIIRTVTMTLTGRIEAVGALEIVLRDAAWIADTGRFAQAVASGGFSEVEPFPDGQAVIVGRGAVIDATKIPMLPRTQK